MVKKLPTKDDLREQLEQETRRYLDRGGKVDEVPQGASGTDPLKARSFQASGLFAQPKSSRTFVPEVVEAIEKRRAERLRRRPVRKRTGLARPRRKVLYDDFGEPIRKVWIDD